MHDVLISVALLASTHQPQVLGFSCVGIEGTEGITRFNVDMKRRKWQTSDGNNVTVTITDTEVRKDQNPYAFARGLVTSDVLSRVDLTYRSFAYLEKLGRERRSAYQCQITEPTDFKRDRRF